MAFDIDDARTYIANVNWQFAKTMPQIPHWYTVRKWRPDLDDDFVNLVLLIRRKGVVLPWPEPPRKPIYHHHYLTVDGWKYWTMGEPVHFLAGKLASDREGIGDGETILINRAWTGAREEEERMVRTELAAEPVNSAAPLTQVPRPTDGYRSQYAGKPPRGKV